MTKSELRKYFKKKILSKEYINKASLIIQNKVIASKEFKEAGSIFIYLSTADEVATYLIIDEAFKQNKAVYVPKCFDGSTIEAIRIYSLEGLKKGMYGILEPISSDCYKEDIDLSIIPCISCSSDGKRLGHGKGYYDRYLLKHQTYKMALCFREMISDEIEMTEFDQFMDKVISES